MSHSTVFPAQALSRRIPIGWQSSENEDKNRDETQYRCMRFSCPMIRDISGVDPRACHLLDC